MMTIEPTDSWLGRCVASLEDQEMADLILEISGFRRNGLYRGTKLRNLATDLAETVEHTDDQWFEYMRVVEDAVLFEAGRRFFNSYTTIGQSE